MLPSRGARQGTAFTEEASLAGLPLLSLNSYKKGPVKIKEIKGLSIWFYQDLEGSSFITAGALHLVPRGSDTHAW